MQNMKKENDDRPALLNVVQVFLFGKFIENNYILRIGIYKDTTYGIIILRQGVFALKNLDDSPGFSPPGELSG